MEAALLEGPPPVAGLMAEGRAGDWMLRNERITIVVRGPADPESFPEETGLLVDAAPAGGIDLLRVLSLVLGDQDGRLPRVESVIRTDGGDSAGVVLQLSGRDTVFPSLRVETRIGLRAGSDAVTLESRLVNEGSTAIEGLRVAERILWGRAEAFVPGALVPAPEAISIPFVIGFGAGTGEETSYAWLGPKGGEWGTVDTSLTLVELGRVDLPPGGEATFSCRFLVQAGSGGETLIAAWKERNREVTGVDVFVRGAGSKRNGVEGARITLLDEMGTPFATGATDPAGHALLPVPPGTYQARAAHPGRGSSRSEPFVVRVGTDSRVDLALPEPARVRLSARGDTGETRPARWTLLGMEGTPDPDFGPPDRGPAAANVVFGAAGVEEIEVPPGDYRLVATTGPGFEAWETTLRLQAGREASVEAILPPLGIPPGWVGADLHVRTCRSRGCTVSLDDRMRALRSDGLGAFVVADEGWRSDPVSGSLPGLSGEEIETVEGGRLTVFPVQAEPGLPGRGALNPYAAHPASVLASLLEDSPEALVQLVQTPAPDSLPIEAFEIMTPDTPGDFGPRWDAWMQFLRQGNRVVATGGSHRGLLVEGRLGSPRTWIKVDSSLVAAGTADILPALRTGRVIVSKGPFIHFTLDGEEVGSVLTRSPGLLQGRVEVFAPAGISMNRVTVYVNGVEDAVYLVGGENRPLRFSEEIEVNLKQSSFVVVVVEDREGGSPGVPPLAQGGETRPIAPLAITNPIWVEIFRASG